MKNEIFRHEDLKPLVHANLVPLIDIIFQLVIFFMLTTTFAQNSFIEVELPKANHTNEGLLLSSTITIDEQDNYYFNGKLFSLPQLMTKISEAKNEDKLSDMVIEGDKSCSYEAFVLLLEQLQQSGITKYQIAITKN